MNEVPEISFCLPVFNSSERIERCLRAIIAQQVPSREILVVDNCSTDDTADKARRLLSGIPGARVVVNEKNLGRIENWNRCLALAVGRYLRFAMVNDIWLAGSTEMLLKEAHHHPEAVMLYSRARYVDNPEAVPAPMASQPEVKVFQPQEMLQRVCKQSRNDTDSLNTILFRSDIIRRDQLQFRLDIPYWADFHLVLEMSARGPVVFVNAETYIFDLSAKGRFATAGKKVLPYYYDVRECAKTIAGMLREFGRPAWEGYGFLFWQYVNHPVNFGTVPLPGYRDTWVLFTGAGPYARQAIKHRFNWGLKHLFNRPQT